MGGILSIKLKKVPAIIRDIEFFEHAQVFLLKRNFFMMLLLFHYIRIIQSLWLLEYENAP